MKRSRVPGMRRDQMPAPRPPRAAAIARAQALAKRRRHEEKSRTLLSTGIQIADAPKVKTYSPGQLMKLIGRKVKV